MGITYTTRLLLQKQDFSDPNWHLPLNTTLDAIDSALGTVYSSAASGYGILISAGSNTAPRWYVGSHGPTLPYLVTGAHPLSYYALGIPNLPSGGQIFWTQVRSMVGDFSLVGLQTRIAATAAASGQFSDEVIGLNYNSYRMSSGQPLCAWSWESQWGTGSGVSQTEFYYDWTSPITVQGTRGGTETTRLFAITTQIQSLVNHVLFKCGHGGVGGFQIDWWQGSAQQQAEVYRLDVGSAGNAFFLRPLKIRHSGGVSIQQTGEVFTGFKSHCHIGVDHASSFSTIDLTARREEVPGEAPVAGGLLTLRSRNLTLTGAYAGEPYGIQFLQGLGFAESIGLSIHTSMQVLRLMHPTEARPEEWWFYKSALAIPGNLGVGVQSWGGAVESSIFGLGNGTAPTAAPADMVQLYAKDYAIGDSRLYLKTEVGSFICFGNDSIILPARSAGDHAEADTNTMVLYAVNSGGKTLLMARFTSGSAQVIAGEP
jgi:hypothetical protein